MLAGEAVVAIWNGIVPERRDEFYAWHLHEHMPERVGIPGFRRGRRYMAVDAATHPEFFTLYEVDTFQVLQGQDYANRLNAPTPWTTATTRFFRDTARALSRVLESSGPGMGAALLTLRFDITEPAALRDLLRRIATAPRICGAHLCAVDAEASGVQTVESRARTDLQAPPSWFAMIEATDPAALAVLDNDAMAQAGASRISRGVYALEYVRDKTSWG